MHGTQADFFVWKATDAGLADGEIQKIRAIINDMTLGSARGDRRPAAFTPFRDAVKKVLRAQERGPKSVQHMKREPDGEGLGSEVEDKNWSSRWSTEKPRYSRKRWALVGMRLASSLGPFRRFNLAHPKLLILR